MGILRRHPLLVALAVFFFLECDPAAPRIHAASKSSTPGTTEPPGITITNSLDLPAAYIRRIEARQKIDLGSAQIYRVESELLSSPYRSSPAPPPHPHTVKLISAKVPPAIARYRARIESNARPMRGFRAPILSRAHETPPVTLEELQNLSDRQIAATRLIHERLAHDGLIPTFVKLINLMEPNSETEAEEVLQEAERLGFPIDLLDFFVSGDGPSGNRTDLTRHLIRHRNQSGKLHRVRFQFNPTQRGYRAADECGTSPIGTVRMQIGGGYRDGIVRGGAIDVAGELVRAIPNARFIASVPAQLGANIEWMARYCWPLTRTNQLILVAHDFYVSPWSQDNGKAGSLEDGSPATLAPRFASRDDHDPRFFAGDSFLMDGLQMAGHRVIHSPLHFQGGNLLVATDPQSDRRFLFVSETEIYRNTALGLSQHQVLECFQLEFAVDECVVLPTASYHLDYDVTVRQHEGELIAFVNEPETAAKILLRAALDRLLEARLLTASAVDQALAAMESDKPARAARLLRDTFELYQTESGEYRTPLVRLFAVNPADNPSFNLRCVLSAIDLITAIDSDTVADENHDAAPLYAALRQLLDSLAAQRRILVQRGIRVVPVPSLPDLAWSVNYLNGIHDREAYLMPAMTGWFQPLDEAATAVFRANLPGIRIARISTPEIQRQHGGVHCVTSAYPAPAFTRRR